jgi:hypothetical protein
MVDKSKSHRLFASFGCVLCVTSVLWRLAAPFLSAAKVISVRSELSSYGPALLMALLGSALLFAFGNTSFKKPLFWVLALSSLFLASPFSIYVVGNDLFLYYSAKRLSPQDWEKVVIALDGLNPGDTGPYSEAVEKQSLPPILETAVGLKTDFGGAFIFKGDANDAPFEAVFSYGPKSRCWGVVLGNRKIPSYLKRVRTISVHPRLTLYVGVD